MLLSKQNLGHDTRNKQKLYQSGLVAQKYNHTKIHITKGKKKSSPKKRQLEEKKKRALN